MFESKVFKKIKKLDPKKDYWEIVRLALFYEFPWDAERALELALYKTYAVPSISKVLHQTRELERNTEKRYDDTDILLSLIIEHGLKEGKGKEALDRMNWIHQQFKISNDEYIYVLTTFVFDSRRWINKFGYRKLIRSEELALYYVWLEIGEAMGIQNIPDTYEALEKFHIDYEKNNFRYSEHNVLLANATENMYLGWYLPENLFDTFRPFIHALMEPHLLAAFHHPEPAKPIRDFVMNALRTRSFLESLVPRSQPFYRSTMAKRKYYKDGYQMEEIGPEKIVAKCPYPHRSSNK
ncbi:MAG: hypothetical protein M9958_12255 [Chitinophagales bacterium]|nr:hypothetical protein [Chitinophagales bacterium]